MPPSVSGMDTTARRLRVVRRDEVSGTTPRASPSGGASDSGPDGPSPDAATEAYWSRVQALRAALDDLRPVG